MLPIQKFLMTHTLDELLAQHGVHASISKNNKKISLNYDQIETKESDLLSQDCRGIILAKEDFSDFITINNKLDLTSIIGKTKVLAFGLKRFFNHGQGAAAPINWNDPTLAVMEKLDGTLCQVYFDPIIKQWCVSTRSVPDADLLMDNGIFTFRNLFEKALYDTVGVNFETFTHRLDKNITYCFELTTPYNRIVVDYKDCRITLIAARLIDVPNIHSPYHYRSVFEELDYHDLPNLGIPWVRTYNLAKCEEILDWVSSLSPMEHEGVVVRSLASPAEGRIFNRIKIKNINYVAYNKIRDNLAMSQRNCMELILSEKDDDVIPFLPEEIVKNLLRLKSGMQAAIARYDDAYRIIKSAADMIHLGDKKTFALLLKKNEVLWSAPFFQIYDKKASSMRDFILQNKKNGAWSSSFLDKLLEISQNA